MSDPMSALGGTAFDGIIRIAEAGPAGMVTVRGDLNSARLREAVETATGAAMPEANRITMADARGIGWMSPDELLLLLPHGDAAGAVTALNAALSGEHALAVDVSDARVLVTLEGEGPRIRETLAKLTPADLNTSALPVGVLRRTRLAQVPAAFWFASETTAHVICFRSVAAYVFGILKHAAALGSEVGYFN